MPGEGRNLLQTLFINLCIMITLTFLGSLVIPRRPAGTGRQVLYVAILIGSGLVSMHFPLELQDGIHIDFRGIPPALMGLYAGPLWATAVALPLAAYRLWLGGSGVVAGVIYPVLTGLISGLLKCGREGFFRPLQRVAWRAALIFVLPAHTLLLVPGDGWHLYLRYGALLWLLHVVALLVCSQVIAHRVQVLHALQELERLAHTDPLTGLPNLRSFEQAFEARDADKPACLLLLDLDHFKQVNDSFGHQVGDEVLRQVAGVIRSQVRPGDVVCRYGGEEFAILLYDVTLDQGRQIAERIRQAVQAFELVLPDGASLHMTVSGGVVPLEHGASMVDRFAEADRMLYRAKGAGRNQISA